MGMDRGQMIDRQMDNRQMGYMGMDGHLYRQIQRWRDKKLDGYGDMGMDSCMNGHLYRQIQGWQDKRLDRQMGHMGMDSWMDGWMMQGWRDKSLYGSGYMGTDEWKDG